MELRYEDIDNNYSTTLSADVTTTTQTVISVTSVPSHATRGFLTLNADDVLLSEVIYFESVGAGTVTVPATGGRGQADTTAKTHLSGAPVKMYFLREHLVPLREAISPTGAITDFAGGAAPVGWLLCKGQQVSRVDYAALYTVIGDTYGAGDGSTTFNVPNLQGKVVAGVSDSDSTFDLADTQGGKTHTNTSAHMLGHTHSTPNHSHTFSGSFSGSTSANGSSVEVLRSFGSSGGSSYFESGSYKGYTSQNHTHSFSGSVSGTTSNSGSSSTGGASYSGSTSAFSIMQPTMALNKIIKT